MIRVFLPRLKHTRRDLSPVLPLILIAFGLAGCYRDTPPAPSEEVSTALVRLLADPHGDVRRTAAESLGKIAQASAERPLARTLDDPDARVRAAAAEALGRLEGGVSTDTMVAVAARLYDDDPWVRDAAARAFTQWEAPPVVAVELKKVLRAPDPGPRRAAAHAALLVDSPGMIHDVIVRSRDPDQIVRQAAVAAMGESADPSVIPVLKKMLAEDPADGVRAEAAYRLGKIGDAAARKQLATVAAQDPDAGVRRWAKAAVEELRSTRDSG